MIVSAMVLCAQCVPMHKRTLAQQSCQANRSSRASGGTAHGDNSATHRQRVVQPPNPSRTGAARARRQCSADGHSADNTNTIRRDSEQQTKGKARLVRLSLFGYAQHRRTNAQRGRITDKGKSSRSVAPLWSHAMLAMPATTLLPVLWQIVCCTQGCCMLHILRAACCTWRAGHCPCRAATLATAESTPIA